MQAVDDVQSFLIGFECIDGLGKFGFRQRAAAVHPFRNAGLRIEALVLHEEDDTLWSRITGGRCHKFGNKREAKCGTGAGCQSLQHFSTVEHDRSFNKIYGQLFVICDSNGTCCGPNSNRFALQHAPQQGR